MEYRRTKYMLSTALQSVFRLFTDKDKHKLLKSILSIFYISKLLTVIFTALFFSVILIYFDYKISIYIICLVYFFLSYYYIFNNMDEGNILKIKHELWLLYKSHNNSLKVLIVKKSVFEIAKHSLFNTTIPYILATLIMYILDHQSLTILTSSINLLILSNLLLYCLFHLKLVNVNVTHTRSHLLSQSLFIMFLTSLLLLAYINFRYNNLNPLLFQGNNITNLLITTFLLVLGFIVFYSFSCVKKTGKSIFLLTPVQNIPRVGDVKYTYDLLVIRSLNYKNKLNKIRIIALILSLFILISGILFDFDKNYLIIGNLVIFCYFPWAIVFLHTNYLYEKLVDKQSIYTNFHLQKRLNIKNHLISRTFYRTVKESGIFILAPIFMFIIVFQPMNIFIALISYFLVYVMITKMFIFRIYQVDDFYIEDIISLSPNMLISKITDTVFMYGIPIVFLGPLLVGMIINKIYELVIIFMICYVLYLLVYVVTIHLVYKVRN